MSKLRIDISALAPAPSKQLTATKLSPATLSKFDKLAGSVITAFLHGLITEKATKRAAKKLNREIRKELAKVHA